jgi:molybdate transport system substrate-binding protein
MKLTLTAAVFAAALLSGSAPVLSAAQPQTVTVFAAASLHNAFTEIAKQFEGAHPGVTVRLNFDGSQILETQIANGAPADVFASADQRSMGKAVDAGLVGTPVDFASNTLAVVAQFDVEVRSLRDLTRDGLKLAICAEQVPCGRYTRIALQKMSADKAYWPKYGDQVVHNVATQEQNVESVVQKVVLGEADAGFVYATDAVQGSAHLIAIPVPDEDQEIATYPIAGVKASANKDLAQSFVDFVLSAKGQSVLQSFGFHGHA